jgi:hypothetical protein
MQPDYQQTSTTSPETHTRVSLERSTITLLVALGALLVAVVGISVYIWFGMQNTPASQLVLPEDTEEIEATIVPPSPGQLSEAEKMDRLQSLRANPDNLTFEEKMQRLESLRID